MKAMRVLGASIVTASTLLGATQGCALFTCIEDDCASLSSGSGGTGVGGAGSTATSLLNTTADVTATGTGGGGGGGAAPCADCPICSAELEGAAFSVTVLSDTAYVLVKTRTSSLFVLPILPSGFGDAAPFPGGPYLGAGHVAATTETVFHIREDAFEDILSAEECDTATPIVGTAGAGLELYFLFGGGLQTFDGCFASKPDDDLSGALFLATCPQLVAFGGGPSSGPCHKPLPIGVSTPPTCLPNAKPLDVAVDSSGKHILFRDAAGVRTWNGDQNTPADLITDFGGAEEPRLPIAANDTEVFFARSTAPQTMWRCQHDPPYACRAAGTELVSSIHVDRLSQTAYFTMGNRVCKWP
jgi:hypothetical protein